MNNIPYKTDGGLFYPETFIYNQQIASGQTGTLVTIGTTGKITELTYLACVSTLFQDGISVDVDGVNVIATGILSDNAPNTANHFGIFGTSSNSVGSVGVPTTIRGEFISIIKDAGNTAQGLVYSYVTGVVK